jgi:hypothetical protein
VLSVQATADGAGGITDKEVQISGDINATGTLTENASL